MNIDDDADDVPDGDAAFATIVWRFALGDLGKMSGSITEEQVVRFRWWLVAVGEQGQA